MIPTDCIQAKVYKQHAKTGKMEFLPSGCPMSMYASPDMYEKDIRQYPVEKFMTPQDKYNYLKDHQKRACDSIKKFVNSLPCSYFWHNGETDDNCEFNGLHIHLLVFTENARLTDVNAYRQMADTLGKRFKMLVKQQKIKMPLNIMAHMQTKPRMLLGCNMAMLGKLVKATNAAAFLPIDENMLEDSQPPVEEATNE